MTKNYEDLGYCVPLNAHIAIDHTLPAFNNTTKPTKRFFMDQAPKRPRKDPPEWVLKKLHQLRKSMDKYR